MKTRIVITTVLCTIFLFCAGQSIRIEGMVASASDSTFLADVNISVIGEKSGGSSNLQGGFSFNISSFPVELKVSHVGYQDEFVHLIRKPSQPFIVYLQSQSASLKGVTVYANRIVNLTKHQPFYIWDYCLTSEGILLLGTQNKTTWDQRVFLISRNGDTLGDAKTREARKLDKDFLGYKHLLTTRTAYQLELSGSEIDFLYPTELNYFEAIMSPLVAGNGRQLILRQNLRSNQVMNYTIYNIDSKTRIELKQIVDEDGLIRLGDKQRLYSMPGVTEADMRFEEMCFYAPIYAPVFYLRDSIILFNFVEDRIEAFDLNGKALGSVRVDFHLENTWGKQIIQDESNGEFYAVFRKSGIYSLKKIDLNTGATGNQIDIPDLPHIEKLKVEGAKLYFLYQDIGGVLKQLYRMDL